MKSTFQLIMHWILLTGLMVINPLETESACYRISMDNIPKFLLVSCVLCPVSVRERERNWHDDCSGGMFKSTSWDRAYSSINDLLWVMTVPLLIHWQNQLGFCFACHAATWTYWNRAFKSVYFMWLSQC